MGYLSGWRAGEWWAEVEEVRSIEPGSTPSVSPRILRIRSLGTRQPVQAFGVAESHDPFGINQVRTTAAVSDPTRLAVPEH
jgi:hypothetical protein